MKVLHSPEQRKMIKSWISQYTATSEIGIQWLLMRAELSSIYRIAEVEEQSRAELSRQVEPALQTEYISR